jgi:HPt (histidine-containing phosphotransfer) domain-containing protein
MSDISELDAAALSRLDTLGGPGFAKRIIGIFLAECPRRLADARAAIAKRDSNSLAHAAHAMISSAGNIGAIRLADFARETEVQAERGRWDLVPDRVERLAAAFEVIRTRLESERGDVPG